QLIEIRDQVVDGTTVIAERDAAIHAAGRLLLRGRLVEAANEFFPVQHALGGLFAFFVHTVILKKASDFSHGIFLIVGRPVGASAARESPGRYFRFASSARSYKFQAAAFSAARASHIAPSARRYSSGMPLTN